MRHWKKYLGTGLLVLCMMILMTACGSTTPTNETNKQESVQGGSQETILETESEKATASENEMGNAPESESEVEIASEMETTAETEPANGDENLVGRILTTTTQVLNLRQKADAGSQIMVRLTPEDLLRVLEEDGDWYKVSALHADKKYEGFVSKDYVVACARGELLVDTPIYDKATSSGKKLADLAADCEVHIFDMKHDCYKVVADADGKEYIGYVEQSNVKLIDELTLCKEIYLTFDDGPGQYTEKLLGILDKYDVKATFFVTNQYSDYIDLIKKEAEAGHSVVVHTYSHDYGKIYKSEKAYFADFDKMADLIEAQTGERPTIFRFPGGSSNTISAKYSKGIMTKLTKAAEERGLVYSDWNVSSGDAGETTKTEKVYKNVIKEIKQNGRIPSVVLQHDIKGFSVDAVEDIIKWGLDNGYTFKAMTETEGIVHHGVNN